MEPPESQPHKPAEKPEPEPDRATAAESTSQEPAPAESEPAAGLWAGTLKPWVYEALAGTAGTFRYYAAHRHDLWLYALEAIPALEAVGDRQREIQIRSDDSIGTEAFDGQQWRLTFPDCCVATGRDATGPWIEEERHLPDMAWPFWSLVAGIVGGLLIAFIAVKFWLWPIGIILGMIVGYRNRRTRTVHLRFRRGESASTRFPEVRVFKDSLLVRLGTPAAKKAFVRARLAEEAGRAGSGVSQQAPSGTQTREKEPEHIGQEGEHPEAKSQGQSGFVAPPTVREELPPIRLDEEEDDSGERS